MAKTPLNAKLSISSTGKPFHYLLAALLAQIVIAPFLAGEGSGVFQDLLFLSLLLAAVRSIRHSRLYSLLLWLSLLCGASVLAKYLLHAELAGIVAYILGVPTILLTIVEVTRALSRQRRVDLDTVFGGLCVYLFMGALWYILYGLVYYFSPEAFNFTVHPKPITALRADRLLFFFSYVTLLTTGYGDIVPLSPVVQMLSMLEGIAGQFYLVFFMARLVGLHVATKEESRPAKEESRPVKEEPRSA